ncbi:peptidase M14 [Gaeumannomyces tritici R3-111a-1]|uniref:Peptidase M14 n=1 Tax=Gaeumannomyces tritici (strain R3-111a-1) TaxID=644352 RepID=J3NYM6_GAET3|nr:peptidase M14 [Gaeumannomyces tritici R3-111a-1]EJT76459.1 peptidase M14 [Gaeumannomyces tritici R3-111a-1]
MPQKARPRPPNRRSQGATLPSLCTHSHLGSRRQPCPPPIMKFTSAWMSLCLAHTAGACLLPGESAHKGPGSFLIRRQGDNTGIAVGTGDRFDGGKTFPRGLGTQPAGTNLESLLSVAEIYSGFEGLKREYGITAFEAPDKTYENRTIFGGAIGGSGGNCSSAYHVYLNGAIHARERGSPDNILYFVSDLLYADKHNTGLTYGGRQYSNCDVKRALKTGIVFVPLSNPDGVAWDQSTNTCWRKNRNPASATPGNPDSVGIDLNRNFDFLFDFLKKFHPDVGPNVASVDPADQTFHGTGAFSEPETRAIKWVMDKFPIRWYLDLHSYTGALLHSWGSDHNQMRKPYMNFMNSSYDSVRGLMPDDPASGAVYEEYMPSNDWRDATYAAVRSVNSMEAATGRHYETMQASLLYPTSGASDDYATSRHFADPSANKIFSYCLEFGFGNSQASCPFYPTPEQYRLNMLEVSAGLMEWVLAAEEIGVGEARC